ncbi:MAG: helix-turn-helix domain-containing protein [Tepidibacter sp.]|uniref:helix-turn-helix domain-containing protein n=1 Tax=Tepidibacter sp. TaxID=2529387 RepID=UPI0025E5AF3D|nr:helix-turn-helix domain-containing protein [Tepidibacter sp.]MCT4508246.1 helix-turn-helix domain-containing protein [Tepidibacter sp.]
MNIVNIEELVKRAKNKDEEAINILLSMFQPLIRKRSYINGKLNEDLSQELNLEFLKCVERFKFKE